MIAFFDLDLNQIAQGSRNYPWPCPGACGRCGHSRLWGHGLVAMLIEGFAAPLMIRRYRCPMCGCIIRLRPKGYFKRHQSSTAAIRHSLAHRLAVGRWPPGGSGSRARHWLRALKRRALAVLGVPALCDLIAAFDRLLGLGLVPVSRAV